MKDWLKQMWFPIGLAAIGLLLIPGLILFGTQLFGVGGSVNEWLQDRFQLTFSLPIPWWCGALIFLVPPLLVLLYFLKLNRKPIAVPSTYLWRKSIEDLNVNSLFQWLRKNILLLLQLLTALGLIYGLFAPRFHGSRSQARHYILMIDNSASMSVTDVQPNRLEQAKIEAIKEIDAATDDDNGMVIVFNSVAEIRQSYTSNRHLLRRAVESIQPTQRITRIDEALTLADSLANPTRSTQDSVVKPVDPEPGKERVYVPIEGIATDVHLFSDGRFPDVPNFSLGRLEMRYHSIGKQGPENINNVGIVNLNALRDDSDPTKLQVFARVCNFGPQPAQVQLQCEARVDGRLAKVFPVRSLNVPAREVISGANDRGEKPLDKDTVGEVGVNFDLPDFDDSKEFVIRCKLVDHQDAFPLDDDAWLVIGVVRKAKVLIVGARNPVLDAFFDDKSTKDIADVTRLSPGDMADSAKYLEPIRSGAFDLVIFDRCGPTQEDEMPRANTIFLGHPPPPWSFDSNNPKAEKRVEKIENPSIKGWTNQSSLLRFLTGLHEIGISEAFRLSGLPPRTPRLMESDQDTGLMVALSRGPFTDIVICFPILTQKSEWNTNWPLLPSFPLFWRNVLFALGNIRDAISEESTQPGQVKPIRTGNKSTKLTVIDPTGRSETLERGSQPEFSFMSTDRVGVYQAEWDAGKRRFAVNLFDTDESNIEPRPAVQVGAESIAGSETRRQPRELWKWFVLIGVLALLTEWYVYNRRIYV